MRLRSSLTVTATPMNVRDDFNSELQQLALQNLQLKRRQRSSPRPDTAPGRSSSFYSGSGYSRRSRPLKKPAGSGRELLASSSAGLGGESSTSAARCSNVLETIARGFPITIPKDEFVHFIDSKGSPDLTHDIKRYFVERQDQHRAEFEQYVNVFKSERPWEPKWFTSFLYKLFLSTKSRPNIYQYIFDIKQRREESKYIQKWKDQSGFLKWGICVTAFLTYLVMICFLIEMYDEEGIDIAVPVTLFITILINKALVNMNSSLPDGI
uniref:ATP synthase protein 8 n=1 Tax=Lygus hesperus TaxID=30085 RepID=A0A0A9VTZ4_LYGHE